jgi:hypothetical protein
VGLVGASHHFSFAGLACGVRAREAEALVCIHQAADEGALANPRGAHNDQGGGEHGLLLPALLPRALRGLGHALFRAHRAMNKEGGKPRRGSWPCPAATGTTVYPARMPAVERSEEIAMNTGW